MSVFKRRGGKRPGLPRLTVVQKSVLAEARGLTARERKARRRLERIKAKAERLMLKKVSCPECRRKGVRASCPVCGGFGQLVIKVPAAGKRSGRGRKK